MAGPVIVPREFAAPAQERSFTAALRHINPAVQGNEPPRMLAVETSLPTASALAGLVASFAAGSRD